MTEEEILAALAALGRVKVKLDQMEVRLASISNWLDDLRAGSSDEANYHQ